MGAFLEQSTSMSAEAINLPRGQAAGCANTGEPAGLELRRARRTVYACLCLALLAAVLVAAAVESRREDRRLSLALSDGAMYYVYLPSLIIDGDLDFRNQITENFRERDGRNQLLDGPTIRGHIPNKYPIGVALTLAPGYLLAHAVAHALFALTSAGWTVPDGYSLPYWVVCAVWLLSMAFVHMEVLDRLLTQQIGLSGRATVLGIALFWLATPCFFYTVHRPLMPHVTSAFWVSVAVWGTAVVLRRLAGDGQVSSARLALVALAMAMAVITRPTNAMLLPVLGLLVWRIVRTQGVRPLFSPLVVVGGAVPLLAQGAVWRTMYGRWIHYTYGGEGFNWTQPALWQTLFSSRSGLFFWSPLLLLAVIGLFLRRGVNGRIVSRDLALCGLAGAGLLWYANSAWHAWWFGTAFGARAFLALTWLFVLGLAAFIDAATRSRPPFRWLALVAIGLGVAVHGILYVAYVIGVIPRADDLF
jgi:hypothetical protein